MDSGDGGPDFANYVSEGSVKMVWGKLKTKMMTTKINAKESMKGYLKGKKD